MIGWSQMNERSHDMTLNRMLLDVSVLPKKTNHICGVMVQVLALSVVDRGFKPRSCQTKDYKIGMCCFSAKHAASRRKSKDWLA